MKHDFELDCTDAVGELAGVLAPERMARLNRLVGIRIREGVADHIGKASVTRHKCADRLGAKHTGYLEFAPARGMMRGGSRYKGGDGAEMPYTEVRDVSERGSTVVVCNTPGLRRAFGPMTVAPQQAKALTIPIYKDAYGRRARDFKKLGRRLFCITSRKGHGLLVERSGDEKHRLRPLYLLVKSANIPQDSGLLPDRAQLIEWTENAAESYLAALVGDS